MNLEQVIKFAKQVGLPHWYETEGVVNEELLVKFAKLVAEHERERIKQANAPEIERVNTYIKELEDAVKAEREACAKLCEDNWHECGGQCANVIRYGRQA